MERLIGHWDTRRLLPTPNGLWGCRVVHGRPSDVARSATTEKGDTCQLPFQFLVS